MTQSHETPETLMRMAIGTTSPRAASPDWTGLIRLWQFRTRSRAALRGLPPEQLADTGISAARARREARKWFWQG